MNAPRTGPMFIPLMSQWFDAFNSGSKSIEWRVYNARWNRQSAHRGRDVVLSKGFTRTRLSGFVVKSRKVARAAAPLAVRTIFPEARYFCAIHISVRR